MTWMFTVHLAATLFMTGLCWFVQVVHYPLFREIELDQFPQYERKNFVTGFITIPVMTLEMLTGLGVLWYDLTWYTVLNMALFGVIGLSTVFFQVPLHLKLRRQATPEAIERLIATNWIRTLSWTVRTVLLCWMLENYLRPILG